MSSEAVFDEVWMRDVERRVIGAPLDIKKFHTLLTHARDVCLADSGCDNRTETLEPPAHIDPVVVHLGASGLRNAFELLTTNWGHFDQWHFPDREGENDAVEFYPGYDSYLRRPQVFSDAPDPEVLRAIESFGADLLHESWRVLGTDAKAQIDALRQAESDEAQVEVFDWLYRRLQAISARAPSFPSETVQGFYHPIRLSAKLVGQFPHHEFAPTCLGFSVIAASFIEQAGLRHLHAGVMRTYHDEMITTYRAAVLGAVANATSDMPEPALVAVTEKRMKLRNMPRDNGFHAVSLTKLKSGAWYCLDPNFDQHYTIDRKRHIKQLNQAYEEIQEFASGGVPLEKTVWLAQDSISAMVSDISWSVQVSVDSAAVLEVLANGDTESLCQRITSAVLDSLRIDLSQLNPKLVDLYESVLELFSDEVREYPQQESDLSVLLRNTIEKYVLWGMSPRDFAHRCMYDERFLERRVQDIRNAVYLAIADITGCEADRYARDNKHYAHIRRINPAFHEVFECGLPVPRIGAAVLSDFDAYAQADHQLSPSFWMTHWASQVPITETRGRFSNNRAQQVRSIAAQIALRGSLNYTHQYAIISEYLRKSQDNVSKE